MIATLPALPAIAGVIAVGAMLQWVAWRLGRRYLARRFQAKRL